MGRIEIFRGRYTTWGEAATIASTELTRQPDQDRFPGTRKTPAPSALPGTSGSQRRMPVWLKVTTAVADRCGGRRPWLRRLLVLPAAVQHHHGAAERRGWQRQRRSDDSNGQDADPDPGLGHQGRQELRVRRGWRTPSGYGKSDVMMLMDISADNKRVSVISFPRDLLVDIPQCTDQKTKQVVPRPQRCDDQRGHGGGRHRLRRGYGQQTHRPRRSTTS